MNNPESRLPNLPSVEDLLAHPTVSGVVEKLNQSSLVQHATGFLEELRQGLVDRAPEGIVPTVEELARKFARRLQGRGDRAGQLINATGMVVGTAAPCPPLAEGALVRMMQHLGEYQAQDELLKDRAEQLLIGLTGAEAACVAHSFASLAQAKSKLAELSVAVARDAGLFDLGELEVTGLPTIRQRLQSAAAVVVAGCGTIGGPPSGIVVGEKRCVETIRNELDVAELEVDAGRLAALVATLEIFESKDRLIHQIPVLQLLSTPLANLQQRCERLAPLVAQAPGVRAATPRQSDSVWWSDAERELRAPSWSIAVELEHHSFEQCAENLSQSSPRLLVLAEEQLAVDLRSVFPRWDLSIVALFSKLAE